ncbi:MAG: hypothetical protein ACRD4Q_11930 [Candidatus Acidiferrales bacterium]
MKATTIVVQTITRLVWLALIVLGALFWSGSALTLVTIHMDLGVIFVILLWIIAIFALFARAGIALPIVAIIWGFIVAIYGMMMMHLVAGGNSWPAGVVHLLIGIVGIGFAERLGASIRRKVRAAAAVR